MYAEEYDQYDETNGRDEKQEPLIEEDDDCIPESDQSASEGLLVDVPQVCLSTRIAKELGVRYLEITHLSPEMEHYSLNGMVWGNSNRLFISLPTRYCGTSRNVIYILDTGNPKTMLSVAALRSLGVPISFPEYCKEHTVNILSANISISARMARPKYKDHRDIGYINLLGMDFLKKFVRSSINVWSQGTVFELILDKQKEGRTPPLQNPSSQSRCACAQHNIVVLNDCYTVPSICGLNDRVQNRICEIRRDEKLEIGDWSFGKIIFEGNFNIKDGTIIDMKFSNGSFEFGNSETSIFNRKAKIHLYNVFERDDKPFESDDDAKLLLERKLNGANFISYSTKTCELCFETEDFNTIRKWSLEEVAKCEVQTASSNRSSSQQPPVIPGIKQDGVTKMERKRIKAPSPNREHKRTRTERCSHDRSQNRFLRNRGNK